MYHVSLVGFQNGVIGYLVTLKENFPGEKKTTLSSRQACFVIAHSSGDFNGKNTLNRRIYTSYLHN